jgi:ABC-type siderophore export system fused ATPase/permease subunit
MASADFSFRFITVTLSGTNKISPGKNAILIRTTAKSTPPILDHKSFASMCMLALIGIASYLVFVHRLTDSFRTSSPRSVTLTQLYFPLLAVVSSQEDFHLQDRAHAGRTHPLVVKDYEHPGSSGRRFVKTPFVFCPMKGSTGVGQY